MSSPPISVEDLMMFQILNGMLIFSKVIVLMICIAFTKVQKFGFIERLKPPIARRP